MWTQCRPVGVQRTVTHQSTWTLLSGTRPTQIICRAGPAAEWKLGDCFWDRRWNKHRHGNEKWLLWFRIGLACAPCWGARKYLFYTHVQISTYLYDSTSLCIYMLRVEWLRAEWQRAQYNRTCISKFNAHTLSRNDCKATSSWEAAPKWVRMVPYGSMWVRNGSEWVHVKRKW